MIECGRAGGSQTVERLNQELLVEVLRAVPKHDRRDRVHAGVADFRADAQCLAPAPPSNKACRRLPRCPCCCILKPVFR